MGNIRITITGLNEIIGGLNNADSKMAQVRRTILNDVSQFMVAELKRNAHVITGRMRDSVRSQQVTDNEVLVEVAAPYAVYENARRGGVQGPHDFADRAEKATRDRFGSIVVSAYGNMFSSL